MVENGGNEEDGVITLAELVRQTGLPAYKIREAVDTGVITAIKEGKRTIGISVRSAGNLQKVHDIAEGNEDHHGMDWRAALKEFKRRQSS